MSLRRRKAQEMTAVVDRKREAELAEDHARRKQVIVSTGEHLRQLRLLEVQAELISRGRHRTA